MKYELTIIFKIKLKHKTKETQEIKAFRNIEFVKESQMLQ
jgi:hypothetical protein